MCLAQFCDHLPKTTLAFHGTILPVVFHLLEDADVYVQEKRWTYVSVCCVWLFLPWHMTIGAHRGFILYLAVALCWIAFVKALKPSTLRPICPPSCLGWQRCRLLPCPRYFRYL